jgi:hypothetical protein
MFVVIAYFIYTRGYNILLKYWYDINLPIQWIGLEPMVHFFYKSKGLKCKF